MDWQFNPKVSIIIPVYNGANFLAEAIDSALAQTYKNIEIIVVNDGSSDGGATEGIAKQYGEKIRYFCKPNGGVSSALNLGIKNMTGEYFSWLSHDDLYLPEKIEHSVNVLRLHKDAQGKLIAYSCGLLVREDKTKIRRMRKQFTPGKIYTGAEAAYLSANKGTLCGCCLLIPRGAFESVGLFDESLRYSQDALMWFSLFFNGYCLCACDSCDVLSRVHKNQVSNTRRDLFLQDSLYVAKVVALELKRLKADMIYFRYTKRLTRYVCNDTIDFLLEYSAKNHILSGRQVYIIQAERFIGKCIFKLKAFIKSFVIR